MADTQRPQPDKIRHSLELFEPINPALSPISVVTTGEDSIIVFHDGNKVDSIKTDALTIWPALLGRFPNFENEYKLAFSL